MENERIASEDARKVFRTSERGKGKKRNRSRCGNGNSVVLCTVDRVDRPAVGGRYAILNKFSWLGYCPPVNLTAWRPTSICDIVIAGVPAKPRMHCGRTAALRGLPSVHRSHLATSIRDWQFPWFCLFSWSIDQFLVAYIARFHVSHRFVRFLR